MKKILVIGAGLSGATIANVLANAGHRVDVIDKRHHIAGNAHDLQNSIGIRVHQYGPHIFHTNNRQVFEYLSKFTEWTPYEHEVQAITPFNTFVPFPPNRKVGELYGMNKQLVLDIFFRPYSKKMWGMELEEMDPDIINRVPIDFSTDDKRYFKKDKYQYMPVNGYTSMVANMLNHENVTVILNEDGKNFPIEKYDWVFNSSPIDEWYDFAHGRLPYRSIKFHQRVIQSPRLFPTATVNFTHSGKFTRVTEWKNFPNHGVNPFYSIVTYEEPCSYEDNNFERYYPVKDVNGINRAIYKKYAEINHGKMTFIGRCGQYVYIDMDAAVNSALQISKRFLNKE